MPAHSFKPQIQVPALKFVKYMICCILKTNKQKKTHNSSVPQFPILLNEDDIHWLIVQINEMRHIKDLAEGRYTIEAIIFFKLEKYVLAMAV